MTSEHENLTLFKRQNLGDLDGCADGHNSEVWDIPSLHSVRAQP